MNFLQRHAYDLGAGFAALMWPFFRRRRRISIDNILRAGVTADPGEAARIAKRAWCHLPGHICEAIAVPGVITKDNWREHLDVAGADPEAVKLLLESPDTPILLVSSHHGVWEAATNLLSFARPMIAIVRMMNNKLVAKWMEKHHFRGPVTMVNKKHGFTRKIISQWVADRAALTMLMDQHCGDGPVLRFFGRPAQTYTTATRLAIRTGYPIVVGSFVRTAPFKYRLIGGAPLRFAKTDDLLVCTQLLNDRLEAAIRVCPEQYLWMHRRWRND